MRLTIELMQFIDKCVGTPLIYALVILVKPLKAIKRNTKNPQNPTIIVTKFFGMGSIVLSVPLLQKIKANHPNCKLAYVSFEQNRPIMESISEIDIIITVSRSGLWALLLSTIKLIISCYKLRADYSIDLEFFSRYSAIISLLSLAPNRCGFYSPIISTKKVFTHKIKFNQYMPIAGNYLSLGQELSLFNESEKRFRSQIPIGSQILSLPETNDEQKTILNNLEGSNLILINTAVGDVAPTLRKWEHHKWAALVNKLIDYDPSMSVGFIGGPDATRDLDIIKNNLGDPSKILDMTTQNLKTSLNLIHIARLLITTDSAPLHMAAALNTKTISIFGPETPILFGHSEPHVTIYANLRCSPCINVFDGKRAECWYDNKCMKIIDSETVFNAAIKLINAKI